MNPPDDSPGDNTAGGNTTGGVFRRGGGVVWRLAPDRVLVRRVGDLSADGCADLIGLAAALWVGLDEPTSISELESRLAEAGIDALDASDVLPVLVERGWIEPVTDGSDPQPDRAEATHER